MKKTVKKTGKAQKGFTLIELLVVVGIMAALAAIIVPNVARFVGSGQTEGAAAEGDALQAGMDAAIADNGFTAVVAGVTVTDFATYDIDPDAVGVLYLYPEYLRIQVPKYGSVTGTPGWTWSVTGEVTKP
ncbi:MAG: type II secretion system GspH family protein [Chloroflexi bacterium]|nr:type II secretion system GspH family protein [Chloroflexota bacterium]